MLFSFFITALPAVTIATRLVDEREAFADYLMTQIEEGRMSDLEIIELAQAYDDEHEGSFGDYTVFNQIDSDVLDEIFAQDDGEPLCVCETEANPDHLPKPNDKAQASSETAVDPFTLGALAAAAAHGGSALGGGLAHGGSALAGGLAHGAGAVGSGLAHGAGALGSGLYHGAGAVLGAGASAAYNYGPAMISALTGSNEEEEAKLSGIICGTCAATMAAAKEEKEKEEKKEFIKSLLEKGKEYWENPPWKKATGKEAWEALPDAQKEKMGMKKRKSLPNLDDFIKDV